MATRQFLQIMVGHAAAISPARLPIFNNAAERAPPLQALRGQRMGRKVQCVEVAHSASQLEISLSLGAIMQIDDACRAALNAGGIGSLMIVAMVLMHGHHAWSAIDQECLLRAGLI